MADTITLDPVRKALVDLSTEALVPLDLTRGLLDLMMWIEKARLFDSKIRFFKQHLPSLRKELDRLDIDGPGWDETEAGALASLHWAVHAELEKVKGAVDSAVEGSTPIKERDRA